MKNKGVKLDSSAKDDFFKNSEIHLWVKGEFKGRMTLEELNVILKDQE